MKRVPAGRELTITEFDLVRRVVFTSDLGPPGSVALVAGPHPLKYGRLAAQWAQRAWPSSEFTRRSDARRTAKLAARTSPSAGPADLFDRPAGCTRPPGRTTPTTTCTTRPTGTRPRALRPLRVLMRDHWEQADRSRSTCRPPARSPSASSACRSTGNCSREVRRQPAGRQRPPARRLRARAPSCRRPGRGWTSLPGWTARSGTLDRVDVAPAVVTAATPGSSEPQPRSPAGRRRSGTSPAAGRSRPGRGLRRLRPPELGKGLLRLEVAGKARAGPARQAARP